MPSPAGRSVSTGEKYVAAAYAVVLAALIVYVAIIALKLGRFEREIAELTKLARRRTAQPEPDREEAHVG